MTKPKIAVVLGGGSAEREISLQTGNGVLAALGRLRYPASSIDFDRGFIQELLAQAPDVVFNALHGGAGEDGTVQAILDFLEVPYQGSGVRASAAAMDKWLTKSLLIAEDLPAPRGVILSLEGSWPPPIPPMIGLPCVVKPLAQGSAVNVHIVREPGAWPDAVRSAAGAQARILVEEYIAGREFTVAILERDALPVVEITPHAEFYSYEAKYAPGGSTHTVPAQIPDTVARRMQMCALQLHHALGCRDYSRVDMMMDAAGSLYVLECNTLPGLTDVSLFPDAARAAGIGYDQVVERLVNLAWSRRTRGLVF